MGVHDLVEQVNGIRSTDPVIRIAGVLITQWRNCELVRQGEEMLRNLGLPVFKNGDPGTRQGSGVHRCVATDF